MPADRYASDRAGKCGSGVLDLFRIEALTLQGGAALPKCSALLAYTT